MKAIINYSTALLHEMLSTHGNSRVEEEGKEFSGLFFPCFPVLRESKCIDVHPRCTVQTDPPFPFFLFRPHSALLLQGARVAQKRPSSFFPPSLRRRRRRLSALGERGGKGRRIMVGSCCSRRRRKRRRERKWLGQIG